MPARCALLGIVPLFLSAAGCVSVVTETKPKLASPVGAMTSTDRSSLRLAFEQRLGGCIHPPMVSEIERVASELVGQEWNGPEIRVGVLRSSDANAFVLPSGHVYLTAGMLEIICSDDELAAVLAHELAHLEDLGAFARSHLGKEEKLMIEASADERAACRLLDAGYDPGSLSVMIAKLADHQPAGWAHFRREKLALQLGVAEGKR